MQTAEKETPVKTIGVYRSRHLPHRVPQTTNVRPIYVTQAPVSMFLPVISAPATISVSQVSATQQQTPAPYCLLVNPAHRTISAPQTPAGITFVSVRKIGSAQVTGA